MRILFAIGIFIFSFALGWYFSSHFTTAINNVDFSNGEKLKKSDFSNFETVILPEETIILNTDTNQSSQRNLSNTKALIKDAETAKLLEDLSVYFIQTNSYLQTTDLYEALVLLENVPFEQAKHLFLSVNEMSNKNIMGKTYLLSFIAGRMAELDVINSVFFIATLDEFYRKSEVFDMTLLKWAQQAPFEALQWVQNSTVLNDYIRNTSLMNIIQLAFKKDFNRAKAIFFSMTKDDQQLASGGAITANMSIEDLLIFRSIAANDKEHSLAWFDHRWTQENPLQMATWIANNIAPKDEMPLKKLLMNEFIKIDLIAAYEWFEINSGQNDFSGMIYMSRSGNIKQSSQPKVLDWMANKPSLSILYAQTIGAALVDNPDAVFDHMINGHPKLADLELHEMVYKGLLIYEPSLANRFLKESAYAENEKFQEAAILAQESVNVPFIPENIPFMLQ